MNASRHYLEVPHVWTRCLDPAAAAPLSAVREQMKQILQTGTAPAVAIKKVKTAPRILVLHARTV